MKLFKINIMVTIGNRWAFHHRQREETIGEQIQSPFSHSDGVWFGGVTEPVIEYGSGRSIAEDFFFHVFNIHYSTLLRISPYGISITNNAKRRSRTVYLVVFLNEV